MGIPLNLDFTMGVAKPIDSRFVMTKAQMLAANDAVMPPVYGCWCNDDGKFYIYNKLNTPNTETGKFVAQPDELSLNSMQSQIDAHNSYVESISELQRQVANIQDSIKANKTQASITNQAFVNGVWKKDFLPDHDRSYFCQKVSFEYEANYTAGQNTDIIKVNGQSINIDNGTGDEEKAVIVKCENGSINIYVDGSIVGNVTDTIILTVSVECSGTNPAIIGDKSGSIVNYEYSFVEYSDVDVKSKNGYPITENFEGEIIYWNTMPAWNYGKKPDNGVEYYSLSTAHTKTVFSMGNYSGSGYQMFGSNWIDDNYTGLPERIIRHIYMANWDLSKFTLLSQIFTCDASTSFRQANPDLMKLFADKFDFTHVAVGKMTAKDAAQQWSLCFPFNRYTRQCGSFAGMGVHFKGVENTRVYMYNNFYIKSFGDLSKWDMSLVANIGSFFAKCYNLEFVGDVGEWNITNRVTGIGGVFSLCWNLRGVSAKIANWDISNATALSNTWKQTFHLGDEVIKDLWKWNTGSCTTMTQMFCCGEPISQFADGNGVEIPKGFERLVELESALAAVITGGGTKAQYDTIAYELAEHIKTLTKKPKTNLSFIEKWNVSNVQQCKMLGAFNPYLVNVGDLRNWNCSSMDDHANGAEGMFMFCTALTTFKMPSFPRGTNVTDIVRGCTALANIEVSQLNVEAISFEDCPLTKQSVLNLINAATTVNDTTTITLSTTTYNAVKDDSDVLAAIDAKAAQNIFVIIGDMSEHTITYHYGAKVSGQFSQTETQTYHTGDTIVPLGGDLNYEYSDEPQYAYYSAGTYSADSDEPESYWFNNFDHWANLPATMPAQDIDIYAVYESERDMWHEGYAMDMGEG